MKSLTSKNTKKLCICPKCGHLSMVKVKSPITDVNMPEVICVVCATEVTVHMDKKIYA